ncbi:MAG: IPT/TIG domain-containing protein, partial [Candidatus Rifleibacteriota bacterium]
MLACGGGSGGSGGTGVAVTGGGGIFSGRVTAPADLRIGLRAQAGSATVVPRALVWLENSPDNTSLTDENGFFTLTNVPFSVAQRVVCRYDIAAGQELYLYRSEPIVINPGEPARQLNDLQLSKGIYSISGVLQNQAGQPVQNARIRLWGIEFSTDSNGYFTSPPLPESADKEKLLIMAPGFRDYEIELPVIKSENNQIKLEITLSDNSEPNFAPVPYFSQVPSQTSPAERILLRLQVIDPDELKSDQFKPIWSKTAGTIEETSNPLEIYWTAPNTAGLATISASVTDSRGATGQVELGIAVGGLKTQVLRIDSVTPAAATHETRITIKGSGFGTDKSKIQISFNGISGVIHSCTDQEIITEVPAGAATGILLLNTPNGEKSAGIFNVIDSSMSISPTFGPPGTVINISGNGFGNSAPNGARVVINGVNATIQSWADELVVASIPENATAGIVSIITGDKTRSVGFFKVTRLFSISESATRHGAQLTITGEGFGDQQGNSVIKFAGPANAPVNSWSDGKIIVQVPADAVTGELTATVQQLTITLGSLDVVGITQMTPTLAIAGNEVTVSGTGFGSEQGSSVLKVGEASAEILSWSNQQIKFKIPPSAKPADVKVVKTGNYSNSTLLTVLGLTSISHSRRPAGSTLTIKGHGFGTNTGFVLLDETALTSFSKWTDEEINLILPTSISGDFQLKVSVQGVRSPALNFSVAKVSGIDNSDGWPGREVIISGQKLGTGQNGDQVLFQNLPAPVISWQDAEI